MPRIDLDAEGRCWLNAVAGDQRMICKWKHPLSRLDNTIAARNVWARMIYRSRDVEKNVPPLPSGVSVTANGIVLPHS